MEVRVFESFEAARPLFADWERFAADNPMLLPAWLAHWWRVYGAAQRPQTQCLICQIVDPQGRTWGIAPLYRAPHFTGHALRYMGDGEACSDYVRILCDRTTESAVAQVLANGLLRQDFAARFGPLDWLEIEGHLPEDPGWTALSDALTQRRWARQERPLCGSWTASLPPTWAEYLQRLAKSRKRKINKAMRLRRDGQVEFRVLSTPEQIAEAWPSFVALHQQRRTTLDQPGCFASRPFAQFLPAATDELAGGGRAHLAQLLHGSNPVGYLLLLLSSSTLAVYQSGFDPRARELEPGHLLNTFAIEWAIAQGVSQYDFLRGDEPYKEGWGSLRREIVRTRWIAPHWVARSKQQLWNLGRTLKHWFSRPDAGAEIPTGDDAASDALDPAPAAAAQRDSATNCP